MEPSEPWPKCPEEDDMGIPPPPPPPKKDVFDELQEELDSMMDFGLDFDKLDELTDDLFDETGKILDDIRARPKSKSTTEMRYDFGSDKSDEHLEDQMKAWRNKLERWLILNTKMSTENIKDLANDELIRLAQKLYEYTLSNGEFKKGHEDAVTKEWFEIKANQAAKREQKKEDRIEDLLEKIKADWRYQIKEVVHGDGRHRFTAQRRSWWTLGLYWESSQEEWTLKEAVSTIEHWLSADVKDEVIIHGASPKTIKGDRNQIMQAMRDRQLEALKKIHVNRVGPPRKRPPPPTGRTQRPPPPPPPPKKRTIHEGIPNPFDGEYEIEIPPMPEGPPNVIIGDLGIGFGSSSLFKHVDSIVIDKEHHPYDMGKPSPYNDHNLHFEPSPEDEEKSMVVELKKSLLD